MLLEWKPDCVLCTLTPQGGTNLTLSPCSSCQFTHTWLWQPHAWKTQNTTLWAKILEHEWAWNPLKSHYQLIFLCTDHATAVMWPLTQVPHSPLSGACTQVRGHLQGLRFQQGLWLQRTFAYLIMRLASRWSCLHIQRISLCLWGVWGQAMLSCNDDLSNCLLMELKSVAEGGSIFRDIPFSFVLLLSRQIEGDWYVCVCVCVYAYPS